MKKFCEDVLKFLRARYGDAYDFEIEASCKLDGLAYAMLTIKIATGFTIKVTEKYMHFIFIEYSEGTRSLEDANLYLWQEELINIVEQE